MENAGHILAVVWEARQRRLGHLFSQETPPVLSGSSSKQTITVLDHIN
jgi:hypothetical protein